MYVSGTFCATAKSVHIEGAAGILYLMSACKRSIKETSLWHALMTFPTILLCDKIEKSQNDICKKNLPDHLQLKFELLIL